MHTTNPKEPNVSYINTRDFKGRREERTQGDKFHNDRMSPQQEGIIVNLHITNNIA